MTQAVERDEVTFREPIIEQKDVLAKIDFAEPAEWKPKEAVKAVAAEAGVTLAESYKVAKLQIIIEDDSVKTEHADARPKLNIDDQFNVQRYPFADKKKGGLGWMNRGKLFDLERAFGFDPVFVDKDGNEVEPYVTRTGNKVAPKMEGVAQVINPDFKAAYFHDDMTVDPTNWIGKKIMIDVGVEKSDQFGDKNVVNRYKKVATI